MSTNRPNVQRIDFISQPSDPLHGRIRVPGDKSISHRALMLGAIAEGTTRIYGFLDGADTNATLNAFRTMGVEISRDENNVITVNGVGLHGLQQPEHSLDLGNSGTSVRLLTGLLAGQEFNSELIGDDSLMARPMRRIIEPLRLMNADVSCTENGTLPIVIKGGRELKGINYDLPVASAQLKSCLLLAGLYAEGKTTVVEPAVSRDHTERMLNYFSCPVLRENNKVTIDSHDLQGKDVQVPTDISSATFFIVAASIIPGSDIVLEQVGVNPTRHAIIEIMQSMGADIVVNKLPGEHAEPIADIHVKYQSLKGIQIPEQLVPIAIDEFPAIFIAAACASGETELSGAEELRVKESDRITAMAEGLSNLGISVETKADGITIQGGELQGGEVDSFSDHRIAMAFSIAGACASGAVTIKDCVNVNTSFPGFVDCAGQAGLDIEIQTTDV